MLQRYATLVRESAAAWSEDYAPSMGAALSYYSLFSIAPLLLIVIGIAGVAFGEEAARGAIFGQLQGLLGADSAKAVEAMLQAADKPQQGLVSTIIGVAILVLGAMTVFGELQNALDRIWRAPVRTQTSGLWNLLRTRLLSFGMILGVAFLLMVSLVLSAALAALGKWWGPAFGVLAHGVDILVSFGLVTVVFALIYRFIPRVHVAWHDVWLGAAVTSLLFAIGKFLIGLYLGKASVASTFGAAGSLVVLMIWVYYSAQIFLFGAEFTWVYAHRLGSRRGQPRPRPAAATQTPAEPPAIPRHRSYSHPVLHASPAPPEKRSRVSRLRRQHPYAGIGMAFAMGAVAALAKALGAHHALARRTRFVSRPGVLSGIKRRWT
ncbi:MAG TPA: YhjD/YihY/BrkB family envelope integrity protein [Burkholderiales bacterium]|nr:YhjD/YihY/BrkB family envelope integrity protein [Burkholderiales bacterium]